MFICTDCQKKYDIKPDFCDCGNNVFEEIKEKNTEKKQQILNINKNTFSFLFFIICIFISLLIILFFNFPKQKEQIKKTTNLKTQKITQTIPEINDFWKDETILTKTSTSKKEEKIKQPTIIKKIENKVEKTVQKQIQTKNKQKPIKQEVKKEKEEIKKIPQPQQTQPKPVIQNIVDEKQEIEKYKKNLRNHFFKKINFAEFYENGECSVSFKINQNGILTDKQISSPSNSIIINEAVFKAVTSTNKYIAPPKALQNYTFVFKVKFYNDNYQVTLN